MMFVLAKTPTNMILLWNLGLYMYTCIHLCVRVHVLHVPLYVVRCWFQFAVDSAALCAVFVWGLCQHRIVFIAARLGLLYLENKLPSSLVSSHSLYLSLPPSPLQPVGYLLILSASSSSTMKAILARTRSGRSSRKSEKYVRVEASYHYDDVMMI